MVAGRSSTVSLQSDRQFTVRQTVNGQERAGHRLTGSGAAGAGDVAARWASRTRSYTRFTSEIISNIGGSLTPGHGMLASHAACIPPAPLNGPCPPNVIVPVPSGF